MHSTCFWLFCYTVADFCYYANLLLHQTDGGARHTRVVLNRVGEGFSCASTSASVCSFDDDSDTNGGTGFSDNSQVIRVCDKPKAKTGETECFQFLVKVSIISFYFKYLITERTKWYPFEC